MKNLRFIGNAFVALASLIWLLHSTVPHHHVSESLQGEGEQASVMQPSWIPEGLLELFSWDLGEKHLEEINLPSASLAVAFLPAVQEFPCAPTVEVVSIRFEAFSQAIVKVQAFESRSRRGPPQWVG